MKNDIEGCLVGLCIMLLQGLVVTCIFALIWFMLWFVVNGTY